MQAFVWTEAGMVKVDNVVGLSFTTGGLVLFKAEGGEAAFHDVTKLDMLPDPEPEVVEDNETLPWGLFIVVALGAVLVLAMAKGWLFQ